MTIKRKFKISKIDHKTAKNFCGRWHYSKTCPPGKYYFGLSNGKFNGLVGIAVYSEPAMKNQKKCYGVDLELRRLCCIDKTPKNTESYFIAQTIKILKKEGIKKILSLADPEQGHEGIIYKASNFKFLGKEKGGGSREIIIKGEKMHSRTAYSRYGVSGIKKLKEMFGEDVIVRNKERKNVYLYEIIKYNRRNNQ